MNFVIDKKLCLNILGVLLVTTYFFYNVRRSASGTSVYIDLAAFLMSIVIFYKGLKYRDNLLIVVPISLFYFHILQLYHDSI